MEGLRVHCGGALSCSPDQNLLKFFALKPSPMYTSRQREREGAFKIHFFLNGIDLPFYLDFHERRERLGGEWLWKGGGNANAFELLTCRLSPLLRPTV